MLFKIQEKFWSVGNHFTITDEQNKPRYVVQGKAFSLGDKLSFQNTQGEELAFISQKLMSLRAKYEIYVQGQLFAEVVKEHSWFKQKFLLDVPGPNDYEIEGSFWLHEFNFNRQGRTVASVQKKAWGWSDSYGVEIDDGEDEVAILCACIVIDQVLDNENR